MGRMMTVAYYGEEKESRSLHIIVLVDEVVCSMGGVERQYNRTRDANGL